jgi:hypothetical protein
MNQNIKVQIILGSWRKRAQMRISDNVAKRGHHSRGQEREKHTHAERGLHKNIRYKIWLLTSIGDTDREESDCHQQRHTDKLDHILKKQTYCILDTHTEKWVGVTIERPFVYCKAIGWILSLCFVAYKAKISIA